MLNKAVLIGRLTKDVALRYTQNGVAVANFILAVNRKFKNSQGEYDADFIPVTVWRGLAENCNKYIGKGRLVAVSGRIETGRYEDKDGVMRYTTEIVADDVVFLDKPEEQNNDSLEGFYHLPPGETELPF